MPLPAFDGADELVEAIDAAVALREPAAITARLGAALARLIATGHVRLPAAVFQADSQRYSRRQLYQSAEHGYSVIAMTWGPGQGTLIHDHDGQWCVEGVWAGQVEITPYELLEAAPAGDRVRFRALAPISAGTGSTGCLIPPFDFHTLHNPDARAVAVTVHVYAQAMARCAVFEPGAGGWFRKRERRLTLDPLPA